MIFDHYTMKAFEENVEKEEQRQRRLLFLELYDEIQNTKRCSFSDRLISKMEVLPFYARAEIVNQKERNVTLLCLAVKNHRYEMCQFIVDECKADLELTSEMIELNRSVTPLWLAVKFNNYDICEVLLKAGAKAENCASCGRSPFVGPSRAASYADDGAVMKLLKQWNIDARFVNDNATACQMNCVNKV